MASADELEFVVAIGASAGGLAAIKDLIAELPADLDAPIVIAVHSEPSSRLADVLKLVSDLPIKRAEDGEKLRKGWIYTVPGATHAFFRNERIHLSSLVRDSGFRPSIDALFMTLAAEYGSRAIAVVLSGTMKDGMRGAQVIYDMGGQTIVQDPKDAQHAGMPNSVIMNDHPETVRSAKELGIWLRSLIGQET
ncbi:MULTISPECIES: chemotaxis protein CheB [unclassified Roseobacter]|uniref:chemotaxis protein CheB n=1 Tax=unclassified Roseobacter TaxID=196798 RepID=UPI0018A299C2|nr:MULTISPECIES: chemotaxis protein CheB [unclassified Roseobacter]MDW3183466.1 chemotaxis protein CheB [Roseobacter sp.]